MSETEYKDTWLVVGDGDLSYSAALSQETGPDTRLIATVWEDEDRHNKVYRDSVKNTNIIRGTQAHEARFGVDATKLTDSFPGQQFDRIVFNFPHWPGKTNTRRNRKLMDEFLSSACKVLRKTPSSEIHVALCERQGGMDVSTIREWKASWKPTAFACEYGLLLRRLVPFQPQYNLSSFRGRDSGFPVGKNPQVYVFGWPSKDPSLPTADYRQQIAFRFELRLELDPEILAQCPFSQYDLVEGDIIPNLIRESVSDDYHCEVPIREIIMLLRSPNPLLGFLVVLAGHHKALTRAQAFQERLLVEEFVYNVLQFPTKKRGSHVSKAFPFYLLPSLMDDYASPVSVASSAELACSKKIRS